MTIQNEWPPISLILPVYNGEKYIREALDSIAAQHYPALELIIIDDGSTDTTPEIIRSFPFATTVITQQNKGVYHARNLGLSKASSDIIAFFDADDVMTPDALKQLCKILLGNPEADYLKSKLQEFKLDTAERKIPIGIPINGVFFLSSGLYRNRAFEKAGTFAEDMKLAGDADWHIRAIENGLRIEKSDFVNVWYRKHENNISNNQVEAKSARIEVLRRRLQRAGKLT